MSVFSEHIEVSAYPITLTEIYQRATVSREFLESGTGVN